MISVYTVEPYNALFTFSSFIIISKGLCENDKRRSEVRKGSCLLYFSFCKFTYDELGLQPSTIIFIINSSVDFLN